MLYTRTYVIIKVCTVQQHNARIHIFLFRCIYLLNLGAYSIWNFSKIRTNEFGTTIYSQTKCTICIILRRSQSNTNLASS